MRPPSLYNYFAQQADLYDALFRLGFGLYDDYMQERLAWRGELAGRGSGATCRATGVRAGEPRTVSAVLRAPRARLRAHAGEPRAEPAVIRSAVTTAGRWREQMKLDAVEPADRRPRDRHDARPDRAAHGEPTGAARGRGAVRWPDRSRSRTVRRGLGPHHDFRRSNRDRCSHTRRCRPDPVRHLRRGRAAGAGGTSPPAGAGRIFGRAGLAPANGVHAMERSRYAGTQAGAYASGTGYRELVHQYMAAIPMLGGMSEDAVNRRQLADRRQVAEELIAELRETGDGAVRNWAHRFRFFKLFGIPHPGPGWLSMRHLMLVIHSRDTWIHRLDICRATGRLVPQTAAHDGRIVALVARDLPAPSRTPGRAGHGPGADGAGRRGVASRPGFLLPPFAWTRWTLTSMPRDGSPTTRRSGERRSRRRRTYAAGLPSLAVLY